MFHKGKSGKSYANPQVRDHADSMDEKQPAEERGWDEGTKGADAVPNHLEALHEAMGGRHMHVHMGDDGAITTHHIGEDGVVEGPHRHGSPEEAHAHMRQFMDKEDSGERYGEESGRGGEGLRHALSM